MICLSETHLDSSYADDDTQRNLRDITLTRADNPHNCKGVGVSIYSKEHLAVLPVSSVNLNKCLVPGTNIQNKDLKGWVWSVSSEFWIAYIWQNESKPSLYISNWWL